MSALEDIFDAAKERIRSPVGGYFFLTWIAINHEFVLAILFGDSLSSRYAELSRLYPDHHTKLLFWVLFPAGWALLILAVIPILQM